MAFILGFKLQVLHFQQKVDGEQVISTAQSILSDYLPDVSDGLNKFYIYCEELERILVGDTSSELLAIVPIDWEKQGNGSGQLINYSADKAKKKFQKIIVSSLHISVWDGEGNLIPFDSGTVLIMKFKVMCWKFECRYDIHYKTQTGTSCEKCNSKASVAQW